MFRLKIFFLVVTFAVFFKKALAYAELHQTRNFLLLRQPGKCTIIAVPPVGQECVAIMVTLLGLKCSAMYGSTECATNMVPCTAVRLPSPFELVGIDFSVGNYKACSACVLVLSTSPLVILARDH